MEITIKTTTELQDELLKLFDNLDMQGQVEVLSTAYKEIMRVKGINLKGIDDEAVS